MSEAGGSVVFEQTFERLPVGVSSVAVDWGADPSTAGAAGSPGARPELDAFEAAATTLVAGDPAALDGESLAAEVARLEMVTARLASREAACVAVLDARGDVQRWGFRSTQAWLRAVVRLGPGAAKGLVALARRLYGKEATSGRGATVSAFAAGRIGLAHAQIVTRTMTEIGSVFPDPAEAATMEKELVAVAERTDPLRLAGSLPAVADRGRAGAGGGRRLGCVPAAGAVGGEDLRRHGGDQRGVGPVKRGDRRGRDPLAVRAYQGAG